MTKPLISLVINTKNSELYLKKCLKSAVAVVDEIIIVDMHSTDQTLAIARDFKATIYQHKDTDFVEPARNFALSKANGAWILLLDADEELSSELSKNIKHLIETDNRYVGYRIPRKNIIFSKWIEHTGWWPDYQLRLFKKGSVTWSDKIHSYPKVEGDIKELPPTEENAIIHHNYDSVSQFINKLQIYTSIAANQQQTTPLNLIHVFRTEFSKRFFMEKGFNDQNHGLILSLLQSFYEVTTQIKIWEKTKMRESTLDSNTIFTELRLFSQDINYWIADWHVQKSTGLDKYYWRIRRKLKI